VIGFCRRIRLWVLGRPRLTLSLHRGARREQRGAVLLEALVLLALALAVGLALRGFGGTLAQSFACAGDRLRDLSTGGGLGAKVCGAGRAVTTTFPHEDGRDGGGLATREWRGDTLPPVPPPPLALPAPDPPPPPASGQDAAGGFGGWAKGAATMAGAVAYELSPLSDLATVFDSEASLLERGFAGVSLLPGGQVLKWGAKGFKAAKKAARYVADSAKAASEAKAAQKARHAGKADEVTDRPGAGKKPEAEDPAKPADARRVWTATEDGVILPPNTDIDVVPTLPLNPRNPQWASVHGSHAHRGDPRAHAHGPEPGTGRRIDTPLADTMRNIDQRLRNGTVRLRQNRQDRGGP
jgi:hypothetical protein